MSYTRAGYIAPGYFEGDEAADVTLYARDCSTRTYGIAADAATVPTYSGMRLYVASHNTSRAAHIGAYAGTPSTDYAAAYFYVGAGYAPATVEVRDGRHVHALPQEEEDPHTIAGVAVPTGEWDIASVIEVFDPEMSVGLGGLELIISSEHTVSVLRDPNVLSFFSYARVGQDRPSMQGQLDIQYSLYSHEPQSYEWALDQEWSLVFPIAEIPLDQQYSVFASPPMDVRVSWAEFDAGDSGITFEIDFKWATAGSRVLHEFSALLNGLRTGLGLLPVSVYDGKGPDIAQRHSYNMRSTGIYAHEDEGFPAGWRYIPERGSRLHEPISFIGENLLAYGLTGTASVDAQDMYDFWYNSPPHYAVMTSDISEGNPNIRYLLGIEYFGETLNGTPADKWAGQHYMYVTFNIIDLGSGRELMPVQINFDMSYSVLTPVVERLGMQWATHTYTKVLSSHLTVYPLIVSVQHASEVTVRVSAEHKFTTYHTQSISHSTAYSDRTIVQADWGSEYDIQHWAKVAKQHADQWSLRVSADNEGVYESSAMLVAQHDSHYEDSLTVSRVHSINYDEALPILVGHRLSYNLIGNVTKDHAIAYSDQVPVQVGHENVYYLLSYDPVRASHRSFYTMEDGGMALIDASSCTVQVSGVGIGHHRVSIAADEGDAVWVMDVVVADIKDFVKIEEEDEVTIDLYGETFVGFVDGKSIERTSSTDIEMSVVVLSPAAKLDTPYAVPQDYTQTEAIGAHALVESILGQAIDWRILDWSIPPFRFAVKGSTPLAAAKVVVEAIGGVIESNPDGTLYARYRFPVTVPDMLSATPDHVFTDVEDNLSSRDKKQFAPVYNKYRIREGTGTVSDKLEFIQDEGSDDSGNIRAYLEPWRPASMQVRHTDGSIVSLLPAGVNTREEEEVVEIRSGEGTLSFPGVSLLSVEWLSDPLGSLYLEPRTNTLRATDLSVNWGHGLVRVKYLVDSVDYRVQFPINNVVQFILLDSGG